MDDPNKTRIDDIINNTPATFGSLNEYKPARIPNTDPMMEIVPRLIVKA